MTKDEIERAKGGFEVGDRVRLAQISMCVGKIVAWQWHGLSFAGEVPSPELRAVVRFDGERYGAFLSPPLHLPSELRKMDVA